MSGTPTSATDDPQGSSPEVASPAGPAVLDTTPGGMTLAWLIERGQSENHQPTIWWKGDPDALDRRDETYETHWTQTAHEATWFPNEAAARAVIDRLFWSPPGSVASARATEHGFALDTTPEGLEAPLRGAGGEPTVHELKCWPPFFDAVQSGEKPFEARKHDRPYCMGDTLVLNEWVPGRGYTGRTLERRISYVLVGGEFGIQSGYCVLGLRSAGVETHTGTDAAQSPSGTCAPDRGSKS